MTLNIGVIGTGAIGCEHIHRLDKILQGSKVVAVSDINIDAAKAALQQLNVEADVYADSQALINSPTVQAVVITSWGPAHEKAVLSAIKAGKYVFCEKPLATTAEGCHRIVDAEVAFGKRLVQVGFMRPFDNTYRALKTLLDAGTIGTPLILNCKHFAPDVDDRYTTDMAITDTLIHELDALRWLLNDDYTATQVIFPRKSSRASRHLQDPQIVLLHTAKGTVINVEISVNCKYGYDIQCEVVGETGIASLGEPSQPVIRKDGNLSRAILVDWKQRFIDAYDVELQTFINNVTTGQWIAGASAWDGYAAAVAADACVKAQTTGAIEQITMPQVPSFYKNK